MGVHFWSIFFYQQKNGAFLKNKFSTTKKNPPEVWKLQVTGGTFFNFSPPLEDGRPSLWLAIAILPLFCEEPLYTPLVS